MGSPSATTFVTLRKVSTRIIIFCEKDTFYLKLCLCLNVLYNFVLSALSKKLRALAKNKDCAVLRKWLPAIQNHMYWTAMSSKSGQEKVAKWKSIINHIQDVHTHDDPLYPKCLHADKVSRDPSKWFQPCMFKYF